MKMNFDAAALAYVRFVLAEKDLKPGALAKNAGVSASTLTRALNDPNHKFKLALTTLEKISDYSGISLAPFLEAKDAAEFTGEGEGQRAATFDAATAHDLKSLGRRIAHARQFGRNGRKTQSDLAQALGVTPQAVSGWERDESCPELDKISALAALLGADVNWLITGRVDLSEYCPARATLPLPEGVVTIEMPAHLSVKGVAALKSWFDLLISIAEASAS